MAYRRSMIFFFQAEDGIRDAQESRGLGDVYKRQPQDLAAHVHVGLHGFQGIVILFLCAHMRTKEEYHDSLKAMKPNVYMGGEVLGRVGLPGTDILDVTFDIAQLPKYQEITTATSHLTGETINRFCHIHQSPEDLLAKQEMT